MNSWNEVMHHVCAGRCMKQNVQSNQMMNSYQNIYSEKATKFCEISTLLLSYVVPIKSKVEISNDFVAFSEYMKFIYTIIFF